MDPHFSAGIRCKFICYVFPDAFSACNEQAGFGIEKRGNAYRQAVKKNTGIVQQQVDNR
jgi:hypothetical protein